MDEQINRRRKAAEEAVAFLRKRLSAEDFGRFTALLRSAEWHFGAAIREGLAVNHRLTGAGVRLRERREA